MAEEWLGLSGQGYPSRRLKKSRFKVDETGIQ
jgi:hypothetical protein